LRSEEQLLPFSALYSPQNRLLSGQLVLHKFPPVSIVQPGITRLLMNLSGNTTTQVSVTSEGCAAAAHKHGSKKHSRKTKHFPARSYAATSIERSQDFNIIAVIKGCENLTYAGSGGTCSLLREARSGKTKITPPGGQK
jgi:hypothetical protein